MSELLNAKGFRSTDKSGYLSPQERNISHTENPLRFTDAVDRLRPGAEKIIENGRWVSIIHDWVQSNGLYDTEVGEEECSKFITEHPEFPYEPAMIKAIIDTTREEKKRSH